MAIRHLKTFILAIMALMLFVLPATALVDSVSVSIDPASPDTTDVLDCIFTIKGNESSYNVDVSWYQDGTAHTADDQNINAQNNTATHTSSAGDIEASDTAKGEEWICAVTVENEEYNSSAVTIQNSEPVLAAISNKNAFTASQFSYTVSASDDDSGDTLTYSLLTKPAGMSISSAGVIEWTPGSSQNGTHDVTVEVSDGTATDTESFQITVNVRKFIIEDLDVDCSEDCEDDLDPEGAMNNGNGGSITEVLPGQTLEITITLENLWSDDDDEDYDVEDIEIEATLEEMGDEDDQEENEEIRRIRAEEEKDVTFSFEIPADADEDTYDLDIRITAEDEAGNFYDYDFVIEIEVEKEDDSMIFERARAMPSSISCNRNFELDILVKNIGADDQDDAQLTIISSPLGISEHEFFDVEEGDYDDDDTEFERTYRFNIADSVNPGTYTIDIRAYYEDDDEYERQQVTLTVNECSLNQPEEEEEEEEEEEVVVIEQPPTTTTPPTQTQGPVTAQPVTTSEQTGAFWDSTAFIVMLFTIFVILLIAVIVLAIIAFTR